MIQYGLVTLFVAAFPLAPFFALINNIIELRLDAYKITAEERRPVPVRIADIGIWMGILKFLTYLAVVSNVSIISPVKAIIQHFVRSKYFLFIL